MIDERWLRQIREAADNVIDPEADDEVLPDKTLAARQAELQAAIDEMVVKIGQEMTVSAKQATAWLSQFAAYMSTEDINEQGPRGVRRHAGAPDQPPQSSRASRYPRGTLAERLRAGLRRP